MPRARCNGIEIEYEISGPADGAPLVLIHGLGAQLIRWSPDLLGAFASAGFRVIRFDNRDAGLSTHLHGAAVPDLETVVAARRAGGSAAMPYDLSAMAADTTGLLDALGVARAHVVGVSLGGMIAQMMAIEHPDRVLSLTVMMSQAGNPALPPADPGLLGVTGAAPSPWTDREAFLDHAVATSRALGSPAYPTDPAVVRAGAAASLDRAYDPAGVGRQLAASRGAPDRREALRRLSVPTLVIHGANDPIVGPACGEDVARNIAGSWLLIVDGMGHDLPAPLFGLFVASIGANCARAR